MSALTQHAKTKWQYHSIWLSALIVGLMFYPAVGGLARNEPISLLWLLIAGLAGGWLTLMIVRLWRGKL